MELLLYERCENEKENKAMETKAVAQVHVGEDGL